MKLEGDSVAAPCTIGVPPMRAHGHLGAPGHATENKSAALPDSNSYLLTPNSFSSLIFVSLESWDDIWRRNQFVCAELARRYPDMRILFVCPPRDVSNAIRTRRLGSLRGPNNWHPEGFPNITVTRPLKLLPSTLAIGRWVNDLMTRWYIRRAALRLNEQGSMSNTTKELVPARRD